MKNKNLFLKQIEILPHHIEISEMQERLEQLAEIIYEYFCQLENSPTAFEQISNLSIEKERTG